MNCRCSLNQSELTSHIADSKPAYQEEALVVTDSQNTNRISHHRLRDRTIDCIKTGWNARLRVAQAVKAIK